MRFDLVVFDLDGTIVDSLGDIAGALNHVLRGAGLVTLDMDGVRACVGDGVLKLVENALARQPVPVPSADAPSLARAVTAYYRETPCVVSRPFPGVEPMLQKLLVPSGRKLAVLTNKPGDVARALLQALALDRYFDVIVGEGDGHPRKPAPDGLLALCARFGVTPDRTLMVGDGLPDLAVARAAGCPSAAAAWGYVPRASLQAQGPTFMLDSPLDLVPLVAGERS